MSHRPTHEELEAAVELAADDDLVFFVRTEDGDLVACVLLNDTFGYALADSERVPWSLLPELRDRVRREGWPAAVRWAAEVRGETPIRPVRKQMDAVDRMRERAERAERAFAAAKAYIDASPCDPDHTEAQWRAWQAYETAVRASEESEESEESGR